MKVGGEVAQRLSDQSRAHDVLDALIDELRRRPTVHVSAILRKLEVSSRGEAVVAATRLALLQDR